MSNAAKMYALLKIKFPNLYKRYPNLWKPLRQQVLDQARSRYNERIAAARSRVIIKPTPKKISIDSSKMDPKLKTIIQTRMPTLAKKLDISGQLVSKQIASAEGMPTFSQKQILQQKLGSSMIGQAAGKVQAAAAAEGQVIDAQTVWPMRQFKLGHKGINIPSSEYGKFDIVRVTRFQGSTPGSYREEYVFDYSPIARHKIQIAGSAENYDKYLRIVREHPELAGLHLFKSFLNVDLALASNRINPRYGASPREEILIQHLHQWKGSPEGKGDLSRMGISILENPFVQISLAEAGGMVAGKVTGGISGRLAARYGTRAVQAFNLAQLGAGTVLTAPAAYQIGKKAHEGRYEEAIPEALMFGLAFGAGWEGFRLGRSTPIGIGKYKGLTPYEKGFLKGLPKSKIYDPLQKEYFGVISRIKQDLRLNPGDIIQQDPTFTNVQALKQYDPRKADLLRNAIKNQLIMLKGKAQASGGAATEKLSTHDIDNLFRSAKDPIVLEYIARRLGIDPNMVFDPHQLPRTGDLITPYGTPKEAPYLYKSGIRGIKLQEQWYRLSESSAALSHEGRIKDIHEAQRILALIYQKQGGVPNYMTDTYSRYMILSNELAANPRLMDPKISKGLYSSNLSKKFWDLRSKFYRKTLTKTYLNTQYNKLTDIEKMVFAEIVSNAAGSAGSYLPPTPSIGSPSMAYSSFFAQFSSMFPGFDQSYLQDLAKSYSIEGSRPGRPGKSRIVKPDSRSIVSNPFAAFFGSDYYRPGSKAVIPGTSKSSIKGSKVFIPGSGYVDISDYYSPPPPTSYKYYSDDYSPPPPYYYDDYSSPPPPTPPPPPPTVLLWPGWGGQVRSRGRQDPYMVQYINEWELMQLMLRDVIF